MALLVISLILGLAGCNVLPGGATPAASPEANALSVTVTPTLSTANPDSLPTPAAAAGETATPIPPAPPPVRYRIQARLDYDRHTLQVSQVIDARTPASAALSELVLMVEPDRTPGVFSLTGLNWADGRAVDHYSLAGGLLRIPLDPPLNASQPISLGISYQLNLPQTASWLGYTARQLNLGDWYPFLPAYREGQGWLVNEPGPAGEFLVYPAADYVIGLEVLPSSQPLVVAASAPPARQEGAVRFYVLSGARAFAFSVSPYFTVLEEPGVTGYVFSEHLPAARAALAAARDARAYYSELFGDFPYPGLALVEGDFFDGMEYSGLFFLGAEYFAAYPGSSQSYLTPLSAHETAHQWWYSAVGNDPALEPWLDEALCTYSELLFFEKYHPDLVEWWWFYRVTRYAPQGGVGDTIYQHPLGFRGYVNAVYLRGALFLDELRELVGNEAFLAFLHDYAVMYSGRVASRADFFTLLRAHTDQDFSDLIAAYFGQ